MGRQCFVFLFRRGTEQPHQGDMNISTSPNMFLIHKNKFRGRNQIRLDPVQLFCNSFCVQHKMVGERLPIHTSMPCVPQKGYSSSLRDTHLSLKLSSFYVCETSSGQLLGLPQISLESIRLPSFYVCRTSSGQLLGLPQLSLGSTRPPLPKKYEQNSRDRPLCWSTCMHG